jgi:hypothetical protein
VLYVRHAAVFGLGTLATRLGENFAGQFEVTLARLKEAKAIEFNDEQGSKMLWRSTQDNITASIGKSIKAISELLLNSGKQAELKALFQYWVQYLPLKFDNEEGLGQHEMLLQILTTKPELIVGPEDKEVLKNLLLAFVWLHGQEEHVTELTQIQIKQVLTTWSSDASTSALIATLNIDDASKSKIQAIINQ